MHIRQLKPFLLIMSTILPFSASAETFYCPDGMQMKCLAFDKKIVDSKTICFDPMRCSQEGFVCKSELDTLAEKHESLVASHNELVDTHNSLISVYDSTLSEYQNLQRCLSAATSLDEAKSCI